MFLSGATKSIYALEPLDVGRTLQVEIVSNGQKVDLMTTGPIEPGWFFSLTFMSHILPGLAELRKTDKITFDSFRTRNLC